MNADIGGIAQVVFALIATGLLIYIAYKMRCVEMIFDMEKRQSIQLTGQSVALGALADCMGCGDTVASRLASLAT